MLSVIIPIYNEEKNVEPLHEELRGVLDGLRRPYEIVYVDDGSSDESFVKLRAIAESDAQVQLVQFRRNFGQTAALAAGIEASVGDVLMFMDGDLQNDPISIPAMLERLDQGYDVISGWRKDRQDDELTRKLPSRLANKLISVVSGVPLHDYGCTLKVYRREVIENVRLYGDMHRFIPAYAAWYGAKIDEMPVEHRARKYGKSKYGISRTFKVILDLLALKFLNDFSTKPIQLFGGLGLLCLLAGGGAMALTLYQLIFEAVKANRNPLLLLGVLFLLAGLIFLTQGLLAEMATRTYHESQHKRTYAVRRRFRGGQELKPERNGTVEPAEAEAVASGPELTTAQTNGTVDPAEHPTVATNGTEAAGPPVNGSVQPGTAAPPEAGSAADREQREHPV
jgi:glycosyltransferase involved in cell wall biosynthesis